MNNIPYFCFNTVNGKGCCNKEFYGGRVELPGFNTVNGKGCCNSVPQSASIYGN